MARAKNLSPEAPAGGNRIWVKFHSYAGSQPISAFRCVPKYVDTLCRHALSAFPWCHVLDSVSHHDCHADGADRFACSYTRVHSPVGWLVNCVNSPTTGMRSFHFLITMNDNNLIEQSHTIASYRITRTNRSRART